jgi:hypothetical protein
MERSAIRDFHRGSPGPGFRCASSGLRPGPLAPRVLEESNHLIQVGKAMAKFNQSILIGIDSSRNSNDLNMTALDLFNIRDQLRSKLHEKCDGGGRLGHWRCCYPRKLADQPISVRLCEHELNSVQAAPKGSGQADAGPTSELQSEPTLTRTTPLTMSPDVTRQTRNKGMGTALSPSMSDQEELFAEAEYCRCLAEESDLLTRRILLEVARQYEAEARLLAAYSAPDGPHPKWPH